MLCLDKETDRKQEAFGRLALRARGQKNISLTSYAEQLNKTIVWVVLMEIGLERPDEKDFQKMLKVLEIEPSYFDL